MQKKRQLLRAKWLATGLFVLMVVTYIIMTWLSQANNSSWIGAVKAFSEAAMVGALADWFAVTALFHHPLGLRIPHTNLIEKGKQKIGSNLGAFVVQNFLTPGNIRPYLQRLSVSSYLAKWLKKERNKQLVVDAATRWLWDLLDQMDEQTAARFIASKGRLLVDELRLSHIASGALEYFVAQGEHQKLVTLLAGKVREFIHANEEMVRQRVKKESYFFIPKFVDNKLAQKIAAGLINYFEEIEANPNHPVRAEISDQLLTFADRLRHEQKWEIALQRVKESLLDESRLSRYALAIWRSIKSSLKHELSGVETPIGRYMGRLLAEWSGQIRKDAAIRAKLDDGIRVSLYKLILRHRGQVQEIISNTVGNWQGNELSNKLELEVGKDLQFIRVNGTIVGGLVGLLIYWLTIAFF